MRLDLFLVEQNFFKTRTKAINAIKNKAVEVNGKIIEKPSFEVETLDIIKILFETNRYVSRGGLKLEAAITSFQINFKDKVVLDIGASTGGFTDCALQNQAKLVYAVDVGSGQLDESLIDHPHVINMEKTNILDVSNLPNIDIIVMDASFVSVQHLIPAVNRFLNDNNIFICLIKPQFEVGKKYLKNGIVKDRAVHIKVINDIIENLKVYDMAITKLIPSPILGGSGNKEFLALIRKSVSSHINVIEICK